MGSLTQAMVSSQILAVSHGYQKRLQMNAYQSLLYKSNLPCAIAKFHTRCNANMPSWEPDPITYAPENEGTQESGNIFDSINSSIEFAETSITNTKKLVDVKNQSNTRLKYFRWLLWIFGPALLLVTGVVPTLWLPVSSIFLGPTIASILSLTGLDCIFNLGAFLFLLMADSSARPNDNTVGCISKPPSTYQLWNSVANIMGFIIPSGVLTGSHKGFFQPQLPLISFAILLGPYFLLLSVQSLTEMLTWHWQSPVWLVTPIVYESYRLLQLMRGLKLGDELGAPFWMVLTIRGLVCFWVLVLGVQLMRVAWYAGSTTRDNRK